GSDPRPNVPLLLQGLVDTTILWSPAFPTQPVASEHDTFLRWAMVGGRLTKFPGAQTGRRAKQGGYQLVDGRGAPATVVFSRSPVRGDHLKVHAGAEGVQIGVLHEHAQVAEPFPGRLA